MNSYKFKGKAHKLHRSLKEVYGTDPLSLFELLEMFKKAMNDLGKSEGIAVRVLSYFLVDDAEDTYKMQMTSRMSHTDGLEYRPPLLPQEPFRLPPCLHPAKSQSSRRKTRRLRVLHETSKHG